MEGMTMKCPECQFDNRDGVNFCEECGAKLELKCPNCNTEIPYWRKFCGECGFNLTELIEIPSIDYSEPQSYTPKFLADKILTTRSSIEGERKLVTVFFADVTNFTAISELLDPEDIHQIMDGCFKILMDEIHKYEGTINQFTGDGVMALFGAPVAHEDHAQRACYAALSIQKAMGEYGEKLEKERGVDFKMRIGLNAGHVIVGSIGNDLRMDYTAVGDTTNLAARMESIAKPGTILGSGSIYKLARGFFEFKPLGKIQVKGKMLPVEAYEIIKASEVETRIEAAAVKGFTKFVGREREMETIKEAFNKTRSGAGQVVGVVGEAGVGKSRLLIELRNAIPKEEYNYLEGRCLHFGGAIAYLPILDILKSYFEIKEEDQEPIIQKKMKEKILHLDERLKSSLPPLQEILSLKVEDGAYLQLEPGPKKIRIFEAIRDTLVCESQSKPLVLVVEDLHWIDKNSEAFLGYLIDWLANTHILLILLYRPEYTHQWGSKSYYSKIGVDQLSTESSAQLVQNILEGGEVVPELRELILKRAEGNPLFVEELTHSLLENGSIQTKDHQYVLATKASVIKVPNTIQGIIAARIDRVEESLKRIMQVASVIGREFAYRILQAIIGMREDLKSSLVNLQGLEFIYERSLFPELEYIFKHALTQEVAYNSLLQKRRRDIHEKIGKAIEEIYLERLEEYYELLAYHYMRSDNKEKAVEYLDLANQKAAKLNSVKEAKAYFDEAMKLLDVLPETKGNQERRISLLVNQLNVFLLLWQIQEYHELLARYEHMAIDLGNQGLLGTFYVAVGMCDWWLGNFDKAIRIETQAAEICENSNRIEEAGRAYNLLQWCYAPKGDFDQVLRFREDVLRMVEQRFNLRWYVWAFCATVWAYAGLCRWEEAVEDGKEALRVAEEFSDNSLISFAAWHICLANLLKGDLSQAVRYGDMAVEKAPTYADKVWAQAMLAWAWCRTGEPHRGLEALANALSVAKSGQFGWGTIGYAVGLGEGYFLAGKYEEANKILKECLELAEQSDLKWISGIAHSILGQVALTSDPAQAAHHFEQSIANFQKTKTDPSIIDFLNSIIMLTKGKLRQGVKTAEDLSGVFLENASLWDHVTVEYILGNIYLQIATGAGPKTLTFIAKNITFLIKSFPHAGDKAEYHLNKAIETANKIRAKLILGQAYRDLGLLHKSRKRKEQARECISKAIQIFKQCKAEEYLKQANEALESLR
jgi:class 3 adenylate cyclase/tetratricopeptide (TPR) repeat protein